jgi:hypothetical protein
MNKYLPILNVLADDLPIFQRARELACPQHSPRHHHLFFPCPPPLPSIPSFPPSIPLLRSKWSLRNPLPTASPSLAPPPPHAPAARFRFGSTPGACRPDPCSLSLSLGRVWVSLGISALLDKGLGPAEVGARGILASMRCSRLVSCSCDFVLMWRI